MTLMNTAYFNTRKVPRPAVSRSSVHIHLGMPIPFLKRPFGTLLRVDFVLVRAQNLHTRHPCTQSSHDKDFNLNSYGDINPKPVNQRAQDALNLPETSPFKRILQGAVKGAKFDSRSSPLLPDEDTVYFCCIISAYCLQRI